MEETVENLKGAKSKYMPIRTKKLMKKIEANFRVW
jgi:hypothetical protein